jgi:cysteine desulfurase/selenocysteine lyase
VHRGVYPLAAEATDLFEGARTRVAQWLRWAAADTVFARNATEALNLVASGWGRRHVGAGDRILVTRMEHHSNFVPWWRLAQETGAELVEVPVDDEGLLDLDALDRLLERGPKLVGLVHVSNVLGTVNPVAEVTARAHAAGAVVLVDGAQAAPHLPIDVREIGADFYAFTGHKLYGPTGIGVLHGRRELLEEMPPFIAGGDMISSVRWEDSRWNDLPWKFEAGTSPFVQAAGLGAAVRWLESLGRDAVRDHEHDLVAYAYERLGEIEGLTMYGPGPDQRGALISFALDVAHPHDVAEILGRSGVCIRAGHHCAQPLMRRLGVAATSRISFGVHNTTADVDAAVEALAEVRRIFGG